MIWGNKLHGVDLFSGVGGLTLALEPFVRPVAYCENDRYAQSVLLQRMRSGHLPVAAIWDDVRTLRAEHVGTPEFGVDIIYGGFPCQDISVAGAGKGLEGSRSGLVFEVFRLIEEIKPTFVFLENVPAIRTRGGERVGKELARRGYDCRWRMLSAAEVGAPHLRNRWFLLAADPVRFDIWDLKQRGPARRSGGIPTEGKAESRNDGEKKPLAYSDSDRLEKQSQCNSEKQKGSGTQWSDTDGLRDTVADPSSPRLETRVSGQSGKVRDGARGTEPERLGSKVADSERAGLEVERVEQGGSEFQTVERNGSVGDATSERRDEGESESEIRGRTSSLDSASWWATEPDVGRVVNGLPARVDRIRGLGNAVVPIQAREAFLKLLGFGGSQ